ncbi:hypothetical protein CPB85DRAFT_1309215 [Mucidula mucida]|nr:hypothetical protein CPB85DRAFT_1309215 [Mucidula mucida]
MTKKNAFIWRRARLGVEGLPPMIEDLSEPLYANLLFDKHCHNCSKTPTKYIQWQAQKRLCKNCLEKGTIMATRQQLVRHGLTASLKSRDVLAVTPNFRHSNKTSHISCYDISTFEKLVEESALFQYGSPQYNAWFARKQKEHKALSKSCKEYETWAMLKMESRATELDSLRRARLESIIARLKADGWDEEVELPYTREALEAHVVVKQPRKLTDRIWDTIRPTLTEIMSNIRADLLEQKLQRAISERTRILAGLANDFFATLPETPHHPPPSALCVHQPFVDIIKNTPHAEDATSKLKEALDSETVLAISAAWREQQEKHLIAMLRRKKGRKADLSLIVNAFTCVECSKYAPRILHYPHFASHSCFYSTEAVGDTKVALWTGKGIKTLEKAVYARCQEFVRMCGLDPDTATAADMDGADVFFHCEECNGRRTSVNGMKLFELMRWRTAMNHHHIGKISRVDDAELIALGRARERILLENELATEPPQGSAHRQVFVCVHCDMAETSKAARAEHLRSVHEIGGEPKAADHYRRTLKNTNTNTHSVIVQQAVRQDEVVQS